MRGLAGLGWVAVAAGPLVGCGGGVDEGAGNDGVAQVSLLEPDAVYGAPLSAVSTVRELPDGRVLVADPLDQVLLHIDLDGGVADTLGRVGDGPGEYRQPDAVWPMPGGRTLLVDLGNGRLTELGSDLVFGDTRPFAVGELGPGRDLVIAIPQAVDARGRLYFRGLGWVGRGMRADSGNVLRLDLESEVVDTVARVKLSDRTEATTGGAFNTNTRISPIPLSPVDSWGVAPDGRMVVVRSGGYRVEWIQSDGSVTSGPENSYEPVTIGRAEMEAWRQRRSEGGGGLGISVMNVNDVMTMTASRGGASEEEDLESYEWPEVMPAFFDGPIPVDAQGRAWVRRHQPAGQAPRYDVFGPDGTVVLVVALGDGRRVVGFGTAHAYVVRMDEYGLQYLERHGMP